MTSSRRRWFVPINLALITTGLYLLAGPYLRQPSPGLQIARSEGLDFQHHTGGFITEAGTPSKLMPETMGAGVVVFDYDNDGLQDLLFISGQPFNHNRVSNPSGEFPNQKPTNLTIHSTPSLVLYRNLGNWRFHEITRSAGLERFSLYAMGAVAADYDGDYDPDLLVTGLGGVRLLNNSGGIYKDVTEQSGINSGTGQHQHNITVTDWTTAATMFDVDGDGDLDILATNYVNWSQQSDIYTTYDGQHKGFTTPKAYTGQPMRLWLQQNDHQFLLVSADTSALPQRGKSLGIALWDFDNDNRLDVVVANDTQANFLLHNLGSGRFREIAQQAGVALDENGNARAGMGIAIADYNNSSQPAIAIGNFNDEPTSFFVPQSPKDNWHFQDNSELMNVAAPTLPVLTFGVVFADIDLDGWQDLLMANGHVEPAINTVFESINYSQPLQWLRNTHDQRYSKTTKTDRYFDDLTQHYPALYQPMVGRGLAVADLDNDGDLDIVASANGGQPRLLENQFSGHYLRVKLIGKPPNTDAVGSHIWLKGRNYTQQRLITTGGSYLSQSELIQTFGVSSDNPSDKLLIKWPDGSSTTRLTPRNNQTLIIRHPKL